MIVFLVGGESRLMDALITKMEKDGHKTYLLTGKRDGRGKYRRVFERYNFPYDSESVREIFTNVNPDLVIFLGAYDTNYDWSDARRESVRYTADLTNLLSAYAFKQNGRFVYLSSEVVYGRSYSSDIHETEPASSKSFQAMAILQGENICKSYRDTREMDTRVLRFDHMYDIPRKGKADNNPCFQMMLEMLKTKGTDLKGKTCLISGSGNVAQYTAEKVLEMGGKVLTMSDSDGYIYDPAGIDREKLDYIMELKNLYRGRIREYAEQYPGVKYVEGARPWSEKADIALPSATQNEINGDDARKLIANGVMAVSEGANMPSTPEAIKVFQEAKILYAPGKAANAGGVSVSGLEMTQNSIKLGWSSEEVDEKLKSIMKNIHAACVQYGTEENGYVNYVKGANVAGFMKVAKAMMAQGIV